jgi:hypothetical protein
LPWIKDPGHTDTIFMMVAKCTKAEIIGSDVL